jgi:hypothetical protein
MASPESFRRLKRRARGLLKAYLKRPMSDSELLTRLIDLCVDNRCERLEELCPEPGALDQASGRPLLKKLAAQVRADGLPTYSLAAVAVPESGKHSLVVDMSNPRHAMLATHPSLKRSMLPHGLERMLPFEFRGLLRSQAAQELYFRRLDPALRDKLEELLFMFPVHLSPPHKPVCPADLPTNNQSVNDATATSSAVVINAITDHTSIETLTEDTTEPIIVSRSAIESEPEITANLAARVTAQSAEGPSIIPAVREKEADAITLSINSLITAARNSIDPGLAFSRLLHAANWKRRALADAAACSEPTVSRWIRNIPAPRSEKRLWNALHERLKERWPSARGLNL